MSPVALERLVLRVKARFGDLFFDWTEIEYRQMLIDLIDENVAHCRQNRMAQDAERQVRGRPEGRRAGSTIAPEARACGSTS